MDNKSLQDEVKTLKEQLSHKKQMLRSQGGSSQKNMYLIPLAIIIAGALVGGGLAYGLGNIGNGSGSVSGNTGQRAGLAPTPSSDKPQEITLRPITKDDHIRGNANAPLTIVEYSDEECPFCKRFHPTMQQVLKEYSGKVRWVYRHFPLDQIHPKTRKEAEATECAGEQGKFWEYVDRIFEVTPSNNGLDPAELPKIAEFVKLDVSKFNACLSSGKYAKRVADDLQDAISAGGQGTPYSVLINAKGEKTPISGAYPFENVKSIIDQNLK